MKLTKANTREALVRDEVSLVVADAKQNITYAARCRVTIKRGKFLREWRIFPVREGK